MASGEWPMDSRTWLPPGDGVERCVLVFTRTPRGEARAKRIAGAEPLFERLWERTLAVASSLPGVAVVVAGDPGPLPLPAGARVVLPQRGDGFGERLENAFADARTLGFQEIVAVGTDSPGLGPGDLAAAFAALREHGAVLGPAADGGVYLIGLRGDAGPLLSGVHWRTSGVFAQLRAQAPEAAVLAGTLADLDGRDSLASLLAAPGLDPEIFRLIAALLRSRPVPLRPRDPELPRPTFIAPSLLRGPPALLS
jgi:glycosyltransferase A (GT-A) superfamily protein (DUF2064 family)